MIKKTFTIGEVEEVEERLYDRTQIFGYEYREENFIQLRNALREVYSIDIHTVKVNSGEYEGVLLENLSEYSLENKLVKLAILEGRIKGNHFFELCVTNSVEYLPLHMLTGDIDDAGEKIEHRVLTGYISCDKFTDRNFISLEKIIRDYATKRQELVDEPESSVNNRLYSTLAATSL